MAKKEPERGDVRQLIGYLCSERELNLLPNGGKHGFHQHNVVERYLKIGFCVKIQA